MADRPTPNPAADAPLDDETPAPVRSSRNTSTPPADEPGPDDASSVASLIVAPQSSVSLLGTRNSFYPQQLGVLGAATGGAFSLASSVQVPHVPLAFGQSMEFSQQGAAVGNFDPGSGQVSLSLPLQAVDSRGNAAPVVLSLTTGTVMTRNANGVLLSLTGEPRSVQGRLRLVGMGKIPPGYGNGAEEQIVMVEILGNLSFPTTSAARSGAGSGTGAL
jgi:hypothetical protein